MATVQMQQHYCPRCRAPIQIGQHHCGSCGLPLDPGSIEMYLRQQTALANMQLYPRFQCPYCHTTNPPVFKSKVSGGGWIVFIILLIIFFPLCWLGLLIQEQYQYCSVCGVTLGR